MVILTSLPSDTTQLDNILTVSLVAVLALIVIAVIIRKAVNDRKAAAATPATLASPTQAEIPVPPGSAGQLKLHNVAPKTAAMLMAIVAEKTGKPLNELRFISIKEVEE